MSKLEKLKSAETLKDLALLLGYQPKNLSYIAYQIDDAYKYTSFSIPKKNGGERTIQAPIEKLKTLQSRLSDLLYDCIAESTSNKSIKRQISHGFQRDFSIITNAQKHINQRYVFNIDVQDFFPTINFGRVRGYFIKNKTFELNPKVATVIAQIACFKNELPQGSPCSPVISNLIAQTLDFYLVQLAKKYNCTYSRYADDITFSSKSKSFPKKIAKEKNFFKTKVLKFFLNKTYSHNWDAGTELTAQIEKSGFTINPKKTRMQFRDSRQVTTGLIVNKKVNVKPEYYKTVRSQCHELFKNGKYYQKTEEINDAGDFITEAGTLSQLEGKLNFIYHTKKPNKSRRPKLKTKHGEPLSKEWLKEHGTHNERKERRFKKPRGIMLLYQRFLYFKFLYSLERPLVICEGKTDSVYLRSALNQLRDDFPSLAKLVKYSEKGKEKEKTVLTFDFFNNHGRALNMWGLGVGAPFLGKLIRIYDEVLSPFKCDGLKHPVIIIVDNDAGPRDAGVYSNMGRYGHKSVAGDKPFYHVTKNLYLIPLPKKADGKDIDFEGLFDDATLKIENNGKVFKRKVVDNDKEYSKDTFSKYVVRKKQKDIDFSGFKPLLHTIEKVITHYSDKKP